MVGRNPGHITQQGQILADLFQREGYIVHSASSQLNRYKRLAHLVAAIARHHSETDVLVLEVYGGASFVVEDIASLEATRFGLPIVMWLHGGALPDFMARFPVWTKRVLRRASLLVTPTDYLARALRQHGFQARIIPNIIDLSAYPYRHRRAVTPRLFWMRTLHPTWNPNMALRVLARLRNKREASLVMAGPDKGGLREAQSLARTLGLVDCVRFTGFLDMSGKAREGIAADIYINTNRVDNAPVALIEACAMGLPVVTTSVGGIPDLFAHGTNALLVRDNDDKSMARSVESLIDNPDLATLLSRNGRRLAERFSWTEVRPQWEQVFTESIPQHQASEQKNPRTGLGAGAVRTPHVPGPTTRRPADVRHLRHRSR
jgi:glycosyltransferase involved in cell wall biosynthesis